ncbi:MAG: metallophosphatase family protein [Prosthecobacter sp.]|jgi:predicted phosphodiesterase|uniref:metallophosphoesterase family protein n=1 Tax=Prosthecobacter sp. TaxID=1965333 RepID=UPI0019FBE7F7|nr:metallophosphoesterase family protein [Prosthecobacter sp.]MBE2286159.1 metallophosphatase family protein [Prosthecobacter sp.]
MSHPTAFISDIHANLPALQAVLADIASQGVTDIICLGDVVGYGGQPGECIELLRERAIPCLKGNHDAMAAGDDSLLAGSSAAARQAIEWTRGVLSFDQRCWLAELPMTSLHAGFETVHASLDEPQEWNYVMNVADAGLHFRHQRLPLCFIGHTHRPAFWVEGESITRDITSIEAVSSSRRQVINVGSVGQPRDYDERACYLLYRPGQQDVWWRRVSYDIPAAQAAIRSAGLPSKLAFRLQMGQ